MQSTFLLVETQAQHPHLRTSTLQALRHTEHTRQHSPLQCLRRQRRGAVFCCRWRSTSRRSRSRLHGALGLAQPLQVVLVGLALAASAPAPGSALSCSRSNSLSRCQPRAWSSSRRCSAPALSQALLPPAAAGPAASARPPAPPLLLSACCRSCSSSRFQRVDCSHGTASRLLDGCFLNLHVAVLLGDDHLREGGEGQL